MSIERPNISLEIEKVLSSDIVLHSSAKYTAVIPPNSVEYSINNAYGASSTNVTVNLKYPLNTLIPTKHLFFVDVYHNVTGLLYGSDGRGAVGTAACRTNLFSYYDGANPQACASPPSVKNVTMVNCPIAHCCTSSEVRIGSRSITNQPNMYYDAASRFLPNWLALRENRLTFSPSTHWDRFVKYDEQTDNSEFSPFGSQMRNNVWCTRSQFISAIYPAVGSGAGAGFVVPIDAVGSIAPVAASFNVHTRFYSGVPNSALNYYLDSDEMMIAPQALDILLTFNNLGNMLRFKDASHWIIPGAAGAAGSVMARISLPSSDCINGGSASFISIAGNKIAALAKTVDSAYFIATGVSVSGKIDIGSSTITPLSNSNFSFISKIVSQNSAVIAPKLTHRFIPHIETFTLVDNQAVPLAIVVDAGTSKYSSIKPGSVDFNGNTVTLSKYPDYLMFYFVHRSLQESSSMAAGAFNSVTNVYLPFSLKFAISGGPLNYTVLSTLPNISPSEGPETLAGNNNLYYPYIVSTDSGDNVSFAEHCGNTVNDVLYSGTNAVSGLRPMNGGIMILKLNKSLIPHDYGLGPQSNVTVLLGPVTGTVINYNTTPVFASKATSTDVSGEENYTLRVCAISDSVLGIM